MTFLDAETPYASFLRVLGPLLMVAMMFPRVAMAADQHVLLEVLINGQTTNQIAEFILRDGKLMAHPDELRDLGLRIPDSTLPKKKPGQDTDNSVLIDLSQLPNLTWRIDSASQQLYITIDSKRLATTELIANQRGEATGRRVVESGTGVTLNYDVVSNFTGGQAGASGALDARLFSPHGVISSNWLGYAGATSGGSGANTAIRLDSTYEYADVNTLRRYNIGDFTTTALSWTRSVHMTGVQVFKDFSTRPDLVTFPLPSIKGTAAVPSMLDVIANGNQVLAQQVQSGPFEVQQLPVIMGAGTIALSVTNALGQQVTVTQPFYASAQLLAPKLQTFSAETGLVRLNWGTFSNKYGQLAGNAVYRRGLSSKFTLEGNLQGSGGDISAGAGGLYQLGNLGIVNFSSSTSAGSGHTGEQFALGAQRIGRRFSIGVSAILADKNYADVASRNGSPIPRKQINANIGLSSKHFGTAGVAYGELNQPGTQSQDPISSSGTSATSLSSQETKVLSANYSIQLHHVVLYANDFKNYSTGGNTNGFQAGLTIPFGKRASANVSGSSEGNVQIQAQKSASEIGEWGYQAYVSAGSSNHEFAQLQYKSPWDLITGGIDVTSGQTTVRLENQGAFNYVDKGFFPSNTIFDSFAIVDTSSVSNVNVLQENRNVGKTNSAGKLLVPDMRSFDINHLTIVSTDIPLDATIDDANRTVRPRDLSGVIVKFTIKISHGALLRLVNESGEPLPVGSVAKLRPSGTPVPVGYDGEAYMLDLAQHNEVEVELPGGERCTTSFSYQPTPGEIPVVGPLPCRTERP